MNELIDSLISRLCKEYGASDTKALVCKLYERIQAIPSAERQSALIKRKALEDVFAAYETWPADIKAKLSLHDLRRMNGWAPRTNFGDWRIDTSAGGPILVYKDCSVIEGEDARYVLGLIAKDTTSTGIDGYQGAFYELADMLGMTAQPRSPKEVWETQMRPMVERLVAQKSLLSPAAAYTGGDTGKAFSMGVPVYSVDFGDEGVGYYVRLTDFNDQIAEVPPPQEINRRFVGAVKQICKDFSCLQNRPYMGDVVAALDGLLEHEGFAVVEPDGETA